MRARRSSTLACAFAVVLAAAAGIAAAAAGAHRELGGSKLALTITLAGENLGHATDAMDQPFVAGTATVGGETGTYHGLLVAGTDYLPLSRCYYCFSASGSLT